MASHKQSNQPTPNGGVRSEIIYLNDDGETVDETVATAAEIIEYDSTGDQVHRTYLALDKEQTADAAD